MAMCMSDFIEMDVYESMLGIQGETLFCNQEPSNSQKRAVFQILELLQTIDEVLSAEKRFENIAKDFL